MLCFNIDSGMRVQISVDAPKGVVPQKEFAVLGDDGGLGLALVRSAGHARVHLQNHLHKLGTQSSGARPCSASHRIAQVKEAKVYRQHDKRKQTHEAIRIKCVNGHDAPGHGCPGPR